MFSRFGVDVFPPYAQFVYVAGSNEVLNDSRRMEGGGRVFLSTLSWVGIWRGEGA